MGKIRIPLPLIARIVRVAGKAIRAITEAADQDSDGGRRITATEAVAIGVAIAQAIQDEIIDAPVKRRRKPRCS